MALMPRARSGCSGGCGNGDCTDAVMDSSDRDRCGDEGPIRERCHTEWCGRRRYRRTVKRADHSTCYEATEDENLSQAGNHDAGDANTNADLMRISGTTSQSSCKAKSQLRRWTKRERKTSGEQEALLSPGYLCEPIILSHNLSFSLLICPPRFIFPKSARESIISR